MTALTKAEALHYGRHANGCVIVDWRERPPGRHRAICEHAFVPHPRGDEFGCNRSEDDEPEVRCGYYRQHHPTMLTAEAGA